MYNDNQVQSEVESYFTFLGMKGEEMEKLAAQRLTGFLKMNHPEGAAREVVYDRGSIMLLQDGQLKDYIQLEGTYREDRIVRFDGETITEINPFEYLDDAALQMKGDSGGSGRRRSSGSGGGVGCNNNNNNNNNNNG
ncbi:MAG: hypothetical protein OEM02_09595 [Desulfobulbaceae bacterium]|nr:hypothetical protein [Desulfobulbaceae bacterium]